MLDALPSHVCDVKKTVNAAEINKRTVIGEVLDHALDALTFLEVLEQLVALSAVSCFHDRTT